MTTSEWRDLPTMADVAAAQAVDEEMTTREQYEEWFIKTFDSRPFPPASAPAFDFCWAGYQAGAASRDAEVAELNADRLHQIDVKTNFMGQLNAIEEERDQLRAQINVLREAATPFTSPDVVDETSGTIPLMDALEKALASTPEQSITEYRNNVIEECASVCDKRSMRKNDGNWTDFEWDSICGTNELAADEIRAMKEQP